MDPAAGVDGPRDVLVLNGRVARVEESISPAEACAAADAGRGFTVVDAAGLWLWPGLVDVHVHFREPGFTRKETLHTGSLAAAAGGYTSVVCEPNTDPPVASVALVRELRDRAAREALVRVYFKAAMTAGRRGAEPADVAALAAEDGVVALSDDGDPVAGAELMADVCRLAARHGMLLSPHCEDSPRALEMIAAGADPGFAPAEPYANEANYVQRDLALALEHGCRIHFSHVSLARSVEAIVQGRRGHDGVQAVTFEACPHHLLLCREDFGAEEPPGVNPPIRPAADRDALRRALMSGAVDVIATDHAPHTAEDKAAGASGLVGLETALGLTLTHLLGPDGLAPADVVRLMSLGPARAFGLPAGTLAMGAPADMVLVDPDEQWTVDASGFRSKSSNTPFGGWRLRGRAAATYVGGREVHCVPGFPCRRTERAG